ncbi:chemotaxis protein [Rhodobacteraceae bacterium]|nr:chemotaxis protein [Paracoccaceae bacterium]
MKTLPRHTPQIAPNSAELSEIAAMLNEYSGIVISSEKSSMVQSRLQKRLRELGIGSYRQYLDFVKTDDGQDERQKMVSALTTNVTHFFREKHHFETLREKAMPELLKRLRERGRVRIWSAGCSNGQEAYSILMTIAEMAEDFDALDLRLLATDIDPAMLITGTDGMYPSQAVEAVPDNLRLKYFTQQENAFQISASLRRKAVFKKLNIHADWPIKGPFDIIFCRNMMIYFSPEAQAQLWKRFETLMAPGGWLFVGHSERVPLDTGSRLKAAGITTYRLPQKSTGKEVS